MDLSVGSLDLPIQNVPDERLDQLCRFSVLGGKNAVFAD